MDQTRFLQRVRMNQFKKVYDRWKQKKLTQKEAAEQLGTFYFLSSKNFMYIADLSFLGRGLLSLYHGFKFFLSGSNYIRCFFEVLVKQLSFFQQLACDKEKTVAH